MVNKNEKINSLCLREPEYQFKEDSGEAIS